MADDYQVQSNGDAKEKPLLELYVKASGIDARRIGADLFCQEFWMELYALYEAGVSRVEVKTVNVNSEAFKKNFLGAQPPIMVEKDLDQTYTDNREIEGRIFHLAKQYNIQLFEKDPVVEKKIENLYRNFKLFLRAKIDLEKGKKQPLSLVDMPAPVRAHYNRLCEQLTAINDLLAERKTLFLLGGYITLYDCELMPRLHHIRIIGQNLLGFDIPHNLTYLWNYVLTSYRVPAFTESCPADQDIIHHYKEQMNLFTHQRETLEEPTKTHMLPKQVLMDIKEKGLVPDLSIRY